MSLKTFLLSFRLSNQPDENFWKSFIAIINEEFDPDLDQHQRIALKKSTDVVDDGNDGSLHLFTCSNGKEIFLTVRYYNMDDDKKLISINGELSKNCGQLFRMNNLIEKFKDRLNSLIQSLNNDNPTANNKQMDLVESIPLLKRDNRGNCLLLDDMQNLAEADLPYTHGLMNFGQNSYKDKEILILGGGDGGLLHELLKESPKFVTMIDIDEKVMLYCRKYLRGACGDTLDEFDGPNYKIIVDDCLRYLNDYIEQQKTFDIIFNDLTDIPISTSEQRDCIVEDNQKLWSFIRKILQLSMKCLRPGGLYLNHAIGMNCKQSLADYEQVINELPDVKLNISKHTRYVPSFMEDWVFYQIQKQ
ncbi:hypothetical protein DERP_006507 [Dermatophagoides pteronyssinus]|uniref:PABS domain-containing protein n=1 Tax=Dermatophagoides pteronyssinus TaxID=6956 RepID=A0ABQ8IR14_DERPT|nr:hypothetical protein DERP_006507 [Dermatophagoides pteronyssinus]